MLPAIQTKDKLKTGLDIIPQDTNTTEIANQVAKKQVPQAYAYQFDGYDPSRDPFLIRKQPILRPLVDFKGLEFHRNWPLEYLSQRLQDEREKELSHFRRLFQLRVNNPYTCAADLQYYKLSTTTDGSKKKARTPNSEKLLSNKQILNQATTEPLKPHQNPHSPETSPSKTSHLQSRDATRLHPTEILQPNGKHALQQKLKTRFKYKYLLHLPQKKMLSTDSKKASDVFQRLAIPATAKPPCKHVLEELEHLKALGRHDDVCGSSDHKPPGPEFFKRLATPKPIPRPQPMLHPHVKGHHPPPAKDVLERLSRPRVIRQVFVAPEKGIPKDAKDWRPMTTKILMECAKLERLIEISRPRNWKDIEKNSGKKSKKMEDSGNSESTAVNNTDEMKDAGIEPVATASVAVESAAVESVIVESGPTKSQIFYYNDEESNQVAAVLHDTQVIDLEHQSVEIQKSPAVKTELQETNSEEEDRIKTSFGDLASRVSKSLISLSTSIRVSVNKTAGDFEQIQPIDQISHSSGFFDVGDSIAKPNSDGGDTKPNNRDCEISNADKPVEQAVMINEGESIKENSDPKAQETAIGILSKKVTAEAKNSSESESKGAEVILGNGSSLPVQLHDIGSNAVAIDRIEFQTEEPGQTIVISKMISEINRHEELTSRSDSLSKVSLNDTTAVKSTSEELGYMHVASLRGENGSSNIAQPSAPLSKLNEVGELIVSGMSKSAVSLTAVQEISNQESSSKLENASKMMSHTVSVAHDIGVTKEVENTEIKKIEGNDNTFDSGAQNNETIVA